MDFFYLKPKHTHPFVYFHISFKYELIASLSNISCWGNLVNMLTIG